MAREAARAGGLRRIDIRAGRDVDVPLSPRGREQARALGLWFARLPPGERPEIVLASPCLRALETARLIKGTGGLAPDACPIRQDERLRAKRFGVLDRLIPTRLAFD